MDNMSQIYHEKGQDENMDRSIVFLPKLIEIERIVPRISKKYQLSNITWNSNLRKSIENKTSYPSKHFIKIINSTIIYRDNIINPPIVIDQNEYELLYLRLNSSVINILDALMYQGSNKLYSTGKKFLYSEHFGVLSISDRKIKNVIVTTDVSRISQDDDDILLPNYNELMEQYIIIWHTHPITNGLGGRIKDGVVYEFPSCNDIYNFVGISTDYCCQASIIFSPEGVYIIRKISNDLITLGDDKEQELNKLIIDLEKQAVKKFKKINFKNPDTWYETVACDTTFIKQYNDWLSQYNLYIEYYPRTKKGKYWIVPKIYIQISLPIMN